MNPIEEEETVEKRYGRIELGSQQTFNRDVFELESAHDRHTPYLRFVTGSDIHGEGIGRNHVSTQDVERSSHSQPSGCNTVTRPAATLVQAQVVGAKARAMAGLWPVQTAECRVKGVCTPYSP